MSKNQKSKCEIDAKEVISMLAGLDNKLRRQAYRQGIRKSLNIVKKETIKNLRNTLKKGATKTKGKYGKTLESGVKTTVYRGEKGGNVHILGDYRLKWFEIGTKARYNKQIKTRRKYLKKKRYTGKINQALFFTQAYTTKEKEVFRVLEQNIADAIRKINQKNR